MQIRCTFIKVMHIHDAQIKLIGITHDKTIQENTDGGDEMINVWKQNITSQHSKKIIWHATVAVALTYSNWKSIPCV